MAFSQEEPGQLTIGTAIGRLLLGDDPGRLSPEAARYARVPAGHPHGYQDCFNAFGGDVVAAIAGEPVDGLPTFASGVRAAAITEAVLASAADGGAWTTVAQPEGSLA